MFLARTVKTTTWNVQTTCHILGTKQQKYLSVDGVPWNINVASQVYQTGIFSIIIILANVTSSPSAFPHGTLLHCSPSSLQNMLFPENRNINNINICTNTEIREVVQCPEALRTELLKELWLEGVGCGNLKGRSKERTWLGFSLSFSYHSSSWNSLQQCPMPSIDTSDTPWGKVCIYCSTFVVRVIYFITLNLQIFPSKNSCCSCLLGWKYLSFYMRKHQQGHQKEEGMW